MLNYFPSEEGYTRAWALNERKMAREAERKTKLLLEAVRDAVVQFQPSSPTYSPTSDGYPEEDGPEKKRAKTEEVKDAVIYEELEESQREEELEESQQEEELRQKRQTDYRMRRIAENRAALDAAWGIPPY